MRCYPPPTTKNSSPKKHGNSRTRCAISPKSAADRADMLREIGVASIDDLFSVIPAEYRLTRDLNVPRQMGESEIIDHFQAAAAEERARLRQLSRRGRVSPLPARHYRLVGPARRIPHLLHALPGRDHTGHAAGHLRVPDHDLRAHRHGDRQRLHVRRLNRRGRGRDDGRPRHWTRRRASSRAPCIPNIAR